MHCFGALEDEQRGFALKSGNASKRVASAILSSWHGQARTLMTQCRLQCSIETLVMGKWAVYQLDRRAKWVMNKKLNKDVLRTNLDSSNGVRLAKHFAAISVVWLTSTMMSGCASLPIDLPSPIKAPHKPSLAKITSVSLPLANGQAEEKSQTYYDPNNTRAKLYDTQGKRRTRLGRYFYVGDFAQSGGVAFRYARVDPELASCLNEVRNQLGKPITVNSSYRSWGYNQKLIAQGEQASKRSFHLSGKAADVYVPGTSTSEFARVLYQSCGCNVGLGVAASWHHVDTRGRKVKPWRYTQTPDEKFLQARRVQKSMCGGGGIDYHEMGRRMLNTANSTFKRLKEKISGAVK